jgi:multiple sugar transport system permease protein
VAAGEGGGLVSRSLSRQTQAAWWMLAPALSLISVFFVVPLLMGFALSFTDFDIYALGDSSTVRLIGVDNYIRLVRDPEFAKALTNTFIYVLVGGPLSVLVSFVAALLVDSKLTRWKPLFRTVYFLPVVTTLVAVAIVWRYLYHPRYGWIDHLLVSLGLPAVDWLGDPRFAMPALIVMSVWKNFGYNMLLIIAGLQAVPEELHEAAHLDGANWWQRLRHVTLPVLAPTLLLVSIVTMVAQFQLFAEPYVMTQGGPLRSTVSVVLLMYEEGFRWWRLGYANALAFVLFALTLIGTWIQLRVQRSRA